MSNAKRASIPRASEDDGTVRRTRLGVPRLGYCAAVAALCLSLTAGAAGRQQPPRANVQHTENKADLALRSEARVDPSTLGVSLSIPLASYPGRAGHGLPVAINYSSKVWRLEFDRNEETRVRGRINLTRAEYAEHSLSGWTSTLAPPRVEFTGVGQYFDGAGRGACELCPTDPMNPGQYYVRRIHVHLPDGSSHELRAGDEPHDFVGPAEQLASFVGVFHAVDSSRMRFESNLGVPSVLYLPDGSRYFFPPYDAGRELRATQYVDRHKNLISYDPAAREWSDTLGRGVADPLPASLPDVAAGASVATHFTVQLVGGHTATYTLRWKRLADLLPVIDAATGERMPPGFPGDNTCAPNEYDEIDAAPERLLFRSSFDTLVCVGRGGGNSPLPFNPVVLAEVELPTGNKYVFTYNPHGEIETVTLPTGGTEGFAYAKVPTLSYATAPYDEVNRGAVRRAVRESAAAAESVWRYAVTSAEPYTVRTTPPDALTHTERLLHRGHNTRPDSDFVKFGFDSPLTGMVYEERVVAPPNAVLRRTLTKWVEAGATPNVANYAARDPKVVKQVSILFDGEGDRALAAATVTRYGQPSQPLNATSVTEYDYDTSLSKAAAAVAGVDDFSPADALALRTTETTFLDDQTYFDRGLVALPTSVTLRAGAPGGAVVSFSATRYDEPAFPLLPCETPVGRLHGEPGVNTRGNATTSLRRLLQPGGHTDFAAHVRYDACGSVRETTDARGHVSKVEYADEYREAYPTRTLTPDPDGAGPLAALESRSQFDFRTGKLVSTTDANGKVTSFAYRGEDERPDPLNRLRAVALPDGGWTKYDYGNTPGNLFVRTRAAIDAARHTESFQYFDGLGRPTRSASRVGGGQGREWVVTDTTYDAMTRLHGVTNPYFVSASDARAADAGAVKWTTTLYDAQGRVETVTTADGARAVTAYAGNVTTATDQAGRRRSSVADAQGRAVRVVEDPGGMGYESVYEYDALNNLRTAAQASQTRIFVYDSLSRLILARIPEQAASLTDARAAGSWSAAYEYDANGNVTKKRDARGVETAIEYDALNRVVGRAYSDGSTPWVTYSYDGLTDEEGVFRPVTNARGRLTRVSSGVSAHNYTAYDAMGRPTTSEQVTGGVAYQMGYVYDLAGNLTSRRYPSGRVVTTGYDGAGRVQSVGGTFGGESRAYASEVAYAAHGPVESLKLGNGLWEHASFNSRLQPERIGLGTSATDASQLRLDYAYGEVLGGGLDATRNNGNVQSQRIRAPGLDLTQSYAYDGLNRLRSAHEQGGAGLAWKQVYKYDRHGNRNFDGGTTTLPGGLVDPVNNPQIDPLTNRVAENQDADPAREYEYDAAGNLTRNALGQSFVYDANNMQTLFNGGPAAGGASYSYDADGRRVKKVTPSGTTLFVYDAAGLLVAEYTTEARPPAAGGVKYLTLDTLGTPRVITDKDGRVVSRHDYLPYGEELLAGRTAEYRAATVSQQFTGQERDAESGLDYFDARYYQSSQGRFTTVDPLTASAKARDPQTWNRYSYALNNPLVYTDPSGMAPTQDGKPFQWFYDLVRKFFEEKNRTEPEPGDEEVTKPTISTYDSGDVAESYMREVGKNTQVVYDYTERVGLDMGALRLSRALIKGDDNKETAVAATLFAFNMVTTVATGGTSAGGKVAVKNGVVIGESMVTRVIPVAKRLGAEYLGANGAKTPAASASWVVEQVKAGKVVLDIGIDATRSRSVHYAAEVTRLQGRGLQRIEAGRVNLDGQMVRIYQWVLKPGK